MKKFEKMDLDKFKGVEVNQIENIQGGEWLETTWKQGEKTGTDVHDTTDGCSIYSDGATYCPAEGWGTGHGAGGF